MSAQIICVTNLKGGVGKTSAAYALAAAAVDRGERVVCLDLDPNGSLSQILDRRRTYPATIHNVLNGTISLERALVNANLGVTEDGMSLLRFLPADRLITDKPASAAVLDAVLDPIKDSVDLIILDTLASSESGIKGPITISNHIVVPTQLDLLCLRITALTVFWIQSLGRLDALRGLLITNIKRPLAKVYDEILQGLQMNGLCLNTIFWFTSEWAKTTAGRSEPPPQVILEKAGAFLDEVLTRNITQQKWQGFLRLAAKQVKSE